MGNATSSAPPILEKDVGSQPKNEMQQPTSSAPPILETNMGNQPKNEEQQPSSSEPHLQITEEGQVVSAPSAVGLIGSLEQQYQKIKAHAEAYPYVWSSYIVVYGGFGLWLAYRYSRLRKTEGRVRVLQEKLRMMHEAEESANSAKVIEKGSTSSGTPPSNK